jgi:hypothetical protein
VDGARALALIGVAAGGLGLLAAVAALVAVGRMRSGGHGGPRDAGSEAGAAPVESLGR